MLFAKRDLKDVLGINLSQRVGRYITASNDDQVNRSNSIDIQACYTLIGEKPSNVEYEELTTLKQTIQQVIESYHTKTGRWLNQEQIAFAATWRNAKQQAATLKERFQQLDIPLSILQHNGTTSLLRLSFLAQALQVTQFSIPKTHSMPVKPSKCSRTLNLALDGTSMTDLEAIGREVRKDCEQAFLKRGINLENTQACWRLTLRYEGCERTLVLKCMPIEMLREVFESQYLQKYGNTNESQPIIIDELAIEIRLADTNSQDKSKNSFYVEQWLSQWQQPEGSSQTGLWLKQNNVIIQKQFSWLYCPVLEDLLANFMTNQPDSTMPDFFLTNHQKDVDEVVMRN